MARVSPLRLFPGDLVLLEIYVLRTEELVGCTSAAFHLNAVNVLCFAPRPTRVPEADDIPDFLDTI